MAEEELADEAEEAEEAEVEEDEDVYGYGHTMTVLTWFVGG